MDLDNRRRHDQQTGSRGTVEMDVAGSGVDVAAVGVEVACIPLHWRN